MNIRHAILMATLALAVSTVQAKQPPITFARSGKTVSVYLAMEPVQSVVLRAYGRVWTKSTKQIALEGQPKISVWSIDVPAVRVPTVFRITPVKDAKRTLGELVAYPDRPLKWDKNIVLYAVLPPYWFHQWADTIGLPVTYILPGRLDKWQKPKDKDKKQVLIIGSEVAGKKFADTLALAKKHKINVLVLDAKWFGDTSGKVTVQPKQMAGGLAELRKQKWSKPLTFVSHRKPWPRIANRWAWISDKEGLPLVERVWAQAGTDKPNSVILLNYVSWQEQLGRNESADQAMSALLLTVSKAEAWNVDGYNGVSVIGWPAELRPSGSDRMLRPFAVSKQRPVLSAISLEPIKATGMGPQYVSILDLRGKQPVTEKLWNSVEKSNLEKKTNLERLLILGDDKLLDDWKWAKINRKKKKFKKRGIAWLPDDTLPPSAENQIRLMLKLTELGIPLKHPKPLKGEKKDEKPNK